MDNGASSYRRFLDGDECAFTEILTLYRENLIFFINRTVHDLDCAEDIAADSFMELIAHPHRYSFKTSLKTYLFTIAHNKTVDYVRHNSVLSVSAIDEQCAEIRDEYASLEESVMRDEEKRALHSAMAGISDEYREVLHLIYFEEMSYRDAARVMGKRVKQIDNLAARGKNALRAVLKKEGYNYEK